MSEKFSKEAREIMEDRFRKDSVIGLATMDGNTPCVRAVNGYYEDGSFYTITHALSGKMRQIAVNPIVAIWATGLPATAPEKTLAGSGTKRTWGWLKSSGQLSPPGMTTDTPMRKIEIQLFFVSA